MSQHTNSKKTLIRLPQVQRIVPFSRSTIYGLISHGEFPAPVKIGSRASAWVEAEVLAWAEGRIAQRDQTASGEK